MDSHLAMTNLPVPLQLECRNDGMLHLKKTVGFKTIPFQLKEPGVERES